MAKPFTYDVSAIPVRVLQRPRDQVLESAEDRPALPCRLIGAKAVALLDLRSAPGAGLAQPQTTGP